MAPFRSASAGTDLDPPFLQAEMARIYPAEDSSGMGDVPSTMQFMTDRPLGWGNVVSHGAAEPQSPYFFISPRPRDSPGMICY